VVRPDSVLCISIGANHWQPENRKIAGMAIAGKIFFTSVSASLRSPEDFAEAMMRGRDLFRRSDQNGRSD
jgi:hypothetical protein